VQDVYIAIRASKYFTAVGPDGLTTIHLKLLGQRALRYLTKLLIIPIRHADIPAIWKSAHIVPILKPGEPADQGLSYRSISLLSPAAKILECLLRPEIVAALPKAKSQHGYAPMILV
jgi:hypothetical protein